MLELCKSMKALQSPIIEVEQLFSQNWQMYEDSLGNLVYSIKVFRNSDITSKKDSYNCKDYFSDSNTMRTKPSIVHFVVFEVSYKTAYST
jgi:hypothetical protein